MVKLINDMVKEDRMYAYVSRKWLFRSLAIAMCLAMVGVAVMPAVGEYCRSCSRDSCCYHADSRTKATNGAYEELFAGAIALAAYSIQVGADIATGGNFSQYSIVIAA